MVTNGQNKESHGVNPNRTPGSTVPGVTLRGFNSVRNDRDIDRLDLNRAQRRRLHRASKLNLLREASWELVEDYSPWEADF